MDRFVTIKDLKLILDELERQNLVKPTDMIIEVLRELGTHDYSIEVGRKISTIFNIEIKEDIQIKIVATRGI